MIKIPVSVGEIIDKLSILHVKQLKISNEEKLEYVNKEFELLYNISSYYLNNQEIENLYHQLVEINKKLWDIEDKLRVIESKNNLRELLLAQVANQVSEREAVITESQKIIREKNS